MNAFLYIHGKNGDAAEAEHFARLLSSCPVIGIDYRGSVPWEAGKEIREAILRAEEEYGELFVIANSIGAYFLMNAEVESKIRHAFFISPIVDMEKLIYGMMAYAQIGEAELRSRKVISTDFGEDLSWEYLSYVREHPVHFNVPTDILYGSKDDLTSLDTVKAFAGKHRASLTVMDGGEHWFHTEEQMRFLDRWIEKKFRESLAFSPKA